MKWSVSWDTLFHQHKPNYIVTITAPAEDETTSPPTKTLKRTPLFACSHVGGRGWGVVPHKKNDDILNIPYCRLLQPKTWSSYIKAIGYFNRFLSNSRCWFADAALRDKYDFQLCFIACVLIAIKTSAGMTVELDFVSKIVCQGYCTTPRSYQTWRWTFHVD
jgi:hypothetical protein